MPTSISTLGLQLRSVANLSSGQAQLSLLNEQLATGRFSNNLSDYSASSAQKLLNFTNAITQREGFIAVAQTIEPRIKVYDQALTALENIGAQGTSLIGSAPIYNPTTNASTASQIRGYMQQINYYLNQQVGDRYIFAGSRYGTAPVVDLTTLAVPPTETAPYLSNIGGNALPTYDADYDPMLPATAVPAAYVKDQVPVDTTQNLSYGISSAEAGFQHLIIGVRFAYAATQDPATYTANMAIARDEIALGLNAIRGLHSALAGAGTALQQTKDLHTTLINDTKGQIGDIQGVDFNAIAVKISTFKAQLEASYAATGSLSQLSLLKYL